MNEEEDNEDVEVLIDIPEVGQITRDDLSKKTRDISTQNDRALGHMSYN